MSEKVYNKTHAGGDETQTQTQKFLDYEGVQHLWSKINMQDYPNNETLMAVINAIDETKADKSELFSGSWNDLIDKPLIEKTIVVDGSQVDTTGVSIVGHYKVSDYAPSKEELLGGSIQYAHDSTATTITENNLRINNYYISGVDCLAGSHFLVVPKDTGNYKKGIYYRQTSSYNHILTFTSNKIFDANKVRVEWEGIDSKPEHYPTNWDLIEDKPEEYISSWEKVNNKPLNHISKATISEPDLGPNVGYASISLDDFCLLSGVMPTLEDFSEGYDVITLYPVETIHYDSSTVLTGDYFDSGFYNVYDSNEQFIIFYEDGKLSDGRDVKKGTYLNTHLITSLIVKPQTVLDPVQIKVDWDGVINKPNFAIKEEFHKIAQSGSWNDLEDKPFYDNQSVFYESDNLITRMSTDSYNLGYIPFDDSILIVAEYNEVNVIFDGVKYITPVTNIDNFFYIGNPYMRNKSFEDNDLPFCFSIPINNPSDACVYVPQYEEMHTVKIIAGDFKTIDEKFIPDTIARVADLPKVATDDDVLDLLIETNIIEPVYSNNNEIFTDSEGNIFCL